MKIFRVDMHIREENDDNAKELGCVTFYFKTQKRLENRLQIISEELLKKMKEEKTIVVGESRDPIWDRVIFSFEKE